MLRAMKHWILGQAKGSHIQFFRYLFVGGSSTVLHLFIFTLCLEYANIHYLIANVIAFSISLIWNYTTSVLWVFERKRSHHKEFGLVFIVSALGLLWNQILLYLFVEKFGFHPLPANILAIPIVLIWNFGARKKIVFR